MTETFIVTVSILGLLLALACLFGVAWLALALLIVAWRGMQK